MKFIFTCVFIFSVCSIHAQSKLLQGNMEEAERLFNQGKLEASKSKLKEIVNEKSDFASAIRLLGLIELRLGNYDISSSHYERLFALKSDLVRGAYFEAAESYHKQYNYEKALEYYLLYKYSQQKDYKTDEIGAQKDYDKVIDFNIANCEYSLENELYGKNDQPEILKGNINSSADEFMPTLTADGSKMLFTSLRSGNEDILISELNNKNEWGTAKSIGRAINTPYNEGMAKITTCGRKIYFAACAWENVEGGCDIYMADYDLKNGIIDVVEPAKGGLNSAEWDSQPSISCDGNTMYFVSNREGGIGGSDIYASKLQSNGIWGPPQNLGSTINTEGDEETPFIAPDGLTLYFTSTGHPGMGDADVFKSILKDDGISWTTPMNLGESVNSPFREAGIVITPDNQKIYFSSARANGKGGLDIYENILLSSLKPKIDNVLLDAYVLDENSKEPIEGAKVKIRSANKTIGNFITDEEGRFFLCLPSGESFSYIVDKVGYDTYIDADIFERSDDEKIHKIEILMTSGNAKPTTQKSSPRLRKNLSVYFESGENELSDAQKEQIAKLINAFDNPSSLKITVSGFADDVGDKVYNMTLSKKRADAVSTYLTELNVPLSNMKVEGKGIVESDLAKHQKRRVEIIILD